MRNQLRLALAAMIVAFVGFTSQASPNKEVGQDNRELAQDRRELVQTRQTLEQLPHAIDLWHDATLKTDGNKIASAQQRILRMLEEDIKNSYKQLYSAEGEVGRSAGEVASDKNKPAQRVDDKRDLRGDIVDVKNLRKLIAVKESLYKSIKKSDSFSYKYRLLGDYQDVLRQELGIVKLELAEDLEEKREDKRQNK